MADSPASSDADDAGPGRIERIKDRYAIVKTHTLERFETERERRASVRMAYDFYLRDKAFAGSLLAGGISVKLFLWFLPFSLSVVVVLGVLSDWLGRAPKDLAEQSGLMIGSLANMVEAAVVTSDRARLYLAVLGIVLLIWAGMGVVRALGLISRLAWGVTSTTPGNKVAASLWTAGFVIAMLAIVGLTNRLQGGPWIVDVLVYIAAIFALAALHVLFLNALPRPAGIPWTVVIPGALLMTVAWLLIRLATVVYFTWRLERATDLYGGLGMAAVFLAWLYIISRSLVASISLNATIWQREEASGVTPPELTTGPAADV
ncbi:MAG: YhjD/YihY/BrkB family envelope integrity protein [Acidimicrobiia bacterium]